VRALSSGRAKTDVIIAERDRAALYAPSGNRCLRRQENNERLNVAPTIADHGHQRYRVDDDVPR